MTATRRKIILMSANAAWNLANFRGGLIRTLIGRGFEVIAAAPRDHHAGRLTAMGCRFVPLSMDNKGTNPLTDMRLLAQYMRIFLRERPDAFLGYTIKPNVYGSLAAHALGIPAINTVSGLGTAFIRDSWLTRAAKALYRMSFSRSRVVFFQNREDRALFVRERLLSVRRTALVPGSGVDLDRFQPIDTDAQPNRAGPRFLLIARMLYDKGVGEFVEAARILGTQRPEARCALLGFLDAENRTAVARVDIERWVAEGIVDYMGDADDVRSHIAAADCVVLPSYREGTPRTLLEAAAMGKPLIATDVPGCREAVDHDRNGLLCKVKDVQDLARTMITFADMPAQQRQIMGKASRAKMIREFDERIVINAYLTQLSKIVSAPSHRIDAVGASIR
jgi:glycosyltransferase involved in cell wall biosynthesis